MIHIDQRTVGRSGLVVPTLGAGVWSWGEKGWWNYVTHHAQNVEPLPQARYPRRYQGVSVSLAALAFDSPCHAAREIGTGVCDPGGNSPHA